MELAYLYAISEVGIVFFLAFNERALVIKSTQRSRVLGMMPKNYDVLLVNGSLIASWPQDIINLSESNLYS